MRHSEFTEAVKAEFGEHYARSVLRDQTLSSLGDMSPEQALATGAAPKDVWRALCDHMNVPVERRLGPDKGQKRV